MSPEEIELIITNVAKERFEFPWLLYFFLLISPFIGSYLGAYLKKRGENLATKDDYELLLEQIKKTTAATENIKSDLAKGNWLHQQSWYLKEKYYSGLLEELYKLRLSLSERLDYYHQPGSEHNDTQISECDYFRKQGKIGSVALKKIRDLQGPAEMIISERAIKALNKFYTVNWEAENFSSHRKEYLENMHTSVEETCKVILEEARLALIKQS